MDGAIYKDHPNVSSNIKYCGKWVGRMGYLVEVRAVMPLLEVRVDLWKVV